MRILIIQTIIPDYRIGFFNLLKQKYGDELLILSGDEDFGNSISCRECSKIRKSVRNLFIFGRKFLWQCLPWKDALFADVVVLNGNLRILSSTLLLMGRRLMGLPTLNWNHLHGQRGISRLAKSLYLMLFDGFIAYTTKEAEKAAREFNLSIVIAAPNACLHADECSPAHPRSGNFHDIIFVGRLIPQKKPMLLLKAFLIAFKYKRVPETARLVFVGDGPERKYLENAIRDSGVPDRTIVFNGHISTVEQLRKWYSGSLVSVSPGYVGLSAIQSFAFGVPMIIARDEPHSPEIEACIENYNAYFFESDSVSSLIETIEHIHFVKDTILSRRNAIAEATREKYCFEVMAGCFTKALDNFLR